MEANLILIADGAPERRWLYHTDVPHITRRRLSQWGPVFGYAQGPGAALPDPDRAHRDYLGHTPLSRTLRRTKRVVKSVARRLRQPRSRDTFASLGGVVGYDQTVRRLVADARARRVDHLACVMDDHVAVSPEGVSLALHAARERGADLIRCTQFDGLLPAVVSVAFLERWLEREPAPDVRRLWSSSSFDGLGAIVDLELADPGRFPGRMRCWPLDEREMAVTRFWTDHAEEVATAIRANPLADGDGRERLEAVVGEYRARFVAGLETYEVVGSLAGVDDVRRGMVTTEKPVVDYFVVASHLARFLRTYAGLRPTSRVVDIGCSWGYFGFILANFLEHDGAYVGVEVQRNPLEWARQRFRWLGDNYRFEHFDVYNAFYNPAGTIPRDAVRLPIEEAWADVILAGSVFTHMAADGVQAYLREFRRVLRPGGIAAFSYDDRSFFGGEGEATIVNKKIPDKTTIYSRERIKAMVDDAGLTTARLPVNFRLFGRTDFQTWYFATVASPDARPSASSG
jgi:SAM-dependent methyltransferase